MICSACGKFTKVTIWSNPLQCLVCRDCKDEAAGLFRVNAPTVVPDDIPGGLVCENYGPNPITFYSHTERRAYMAAHGLQEKEKFCPAPGTDKDLQGIPNPEGYVDDYTMRNREELFLRAHNRGAQKAAPFDAVESGVLSNLTVEVKTEEEAIRASQ